MKISAEGVAVDDALGGGSGNDRFEALLRAMFVMLAFAGRAVVDDMWERAVSVGVMVEVEKRELS